jgi:hypothetical protein
LITASTSFLLHNFEALQERAEGFAAKGVRGLIVIVVIAVATQPAVFHFV